MDTDRFDSLTRSFAPLLARRTLAGVLSLGALAIPALVEAKKKRKKKKVTFNDFGCVNVGGFCQNGGQCCSGICQGKKPKKGKKDKRRCVARNALDCPAGADSCAQSVSCGTEGVCLQTTGQASFCAGGGFCFACTKDVDCEASMGPGAACIVCTRRCPQTGDTACFATD